MTPLLTTLTDIKHTVMAGVSRLSHLSSAWRALLLSAAFIILSAYASEGRQCYWCGPLAEQVHRSRRAPPCGSGERHVTICEPGYEHCAIVATSPPYKESRFCVKVYQDECYPSFCNTSRTWKMTCPCSGELCNGESTEREQEAFSAVARLSKTHSHVKKRTPTIQLSGNRKGRIVNPVPNEDETLDGNLVNEEKIILENDLKQNDSLIIDQMVYKGDTTVDTTVFVTENTPLFTIPTTKETAVRENEEAQKDTGNKLENGGNVQLTTIKNEESRRIPTPTAIDMIEIDIVQKPSNLDKHDMKDQKDVQTEETMLNDQPGEGNKNLMNEGESKNKKSSPGEYKASETTTALKLTSESTETTKQTLQNDLTGKFDEKIEPDQSVDPNETKPVEKVQNVVSETVAPGQENPKSKTQEDVPTTSKVKLSTIAPATSPAFANTSSTQSTKNDATRLFITTLIIIICISLSSII